MQIQFIDSDNWDIDQSKFIKYIDRLSKEVQPVEGFLNVVFVDDEYIHILNKRYRNKDKPTDVLSFSYLGQNDNFDPDLIGEIYISVPTAKRQAKDVNWPLSNELNKLFVHGFLHIFGYDHETDEEYIVMKAVEDRVLFD